MRKHAMMPEFLETVRCFQDKFCDVEEAFGEVAVVFKYPENNRRHEGLDAWSIRQIGVYQSFSWKSHTSFWLSLNPKHDSAADGKIKRLLMQPVDSMRYQHQPLLIALVVLSTFFNNWRSLMAFYEKEELRTSGMVISAEIHEKLQFSHSTLSYLHRLENRLLLLPPIFQSLMRTIDKLNAFVDMFRIHCNTSTEEQRAVKETLENYKIMVEEYSQNALFILSKVRASSQLLLDTLNLKHQRIAQKTSESTLTINNSAASDSATVRVITVVTLLYLPATFIAVRVPTT
ncbi:hypothetical protein ACLMJK_007817 [Lecanora helva]